MLNPDDVHKKLEALIEPVRTTEIVPIADALSRVTAATIKAPISLPPFDASAMDG